MKAPASDDKPRPACPARPVPRAKGSPWTTSLAVAGLLVLCLSLLPWPQAGRALAAARLAWISFTGLIGFLILRTGRISRWRSLFFVVLAWAFIVHFKAMLLGLGKSPVFSPDVQEVPYCHIAIASSILNHAYSQYLAWQSGSWREWGPLSLGAFWLVVTFSLGQAWCSWACFYGGLDDGFSRLRRRPPYRVLPIPKLLRELPAAILLVSVLASLAMMLPAFCLWLCPLKFTTAFLDTHGSARNLQAGIFIAVGVLAIVLVPAVWGKRSFCGLICPFGAWQALFGGLNPFRVAVSAEACTGCGLCARACPVFAVDAPPGGLAKIGPYCNRCGECVDACPAAAIEFRLRGGARAGTLFVFTALLVGGAVGAVFVPETLARAARALIR